MLLTVPLSFQYYQPTLLGDLYTCFIWAFAQADAPLRLSYDDFSIRMSEKLGLNGEISGVMLEDEALIGFVLQSRAPFQGLDTVYNGGTGVLVEYRGKGIIQEIYENLLPHLRESGAERILLEVITTNLSALKLYQVMGFKKKQLLHCFKGAVLLDLPLNHLIFRESQDFKLDRFKAFADFSPSFIDSNARLNANWKYEKLIEGYQGETLMGYIIFQQHLGRISQMGVRKDCRRQGVGTALLGYAQQECQRELTVMNIPSEAKGMFSFLRNTGLVNNVDQYEMEMRL